MKTPKISLSFSKYPDAGMLAKSQLILSKMSGNANFPDPVPGLGTVEDAIDSYNTALTAAMKLGTDNVALKNAARLVLENVLRELGRWVMFIANGNITILLSSGYDLNKEPEPAYITAPTVITVSNGINSGSLVAKTPRVPGANGYVHQITDTLPGNDTAWTSTATSTSRFVHTELEPGKQYWLRIAATGSKQQIAYGPVASKYAQ
jgi:hypothetical protein